ncbi:MAG TPA: DUF4907 domain-containing protein [Smithella sp.]|nr:DUF4907 domain-containing protein [Smithella sp.]
MFGKQKALDRISLFLFLFALAVLSSRVDAAAPKKNFPDTDKVAYRVFPLPDRTFGYDILVNGRRFIHQPHIPALPGKRGFATRKRAEKVAAFVARKVRRHEIPPTVTVEDLKRMKVLDSEVR